MQATHREIYKQVSEKKEIPEHLVKLVGDAMFKEWVAHLKSPKSIILKIKKIGRMYLRKNKIERVVNRVMVYEKTKDEDELRKENYRNRLIEYEEYISNKKDIQAIRREHQPLIPKDEPEDQD